MKRDYSQLRDLAKKLGQTIRDLREAGYKKDQDTVNTLIVQAHQEILDITIWNSQDYEEEQ